MSRAFLGTCPRLTSSRITETGVEILTRYSKNKKKKKKNAGGPNGAGPTGTSNDVVNGDDTPEGAATPTTEAAQGVEGLKVV